MRDIKVEIGDCEYSGGQAYLVRVTGEALKHDAVCSALLAQGYRLYDGFHEGLSIFEHHDKPWAEVQDGELKLWSAYTADNPFDQLDGAWKPNGVMSLDNMLDVAAVLRSILI